MSYMAEQISSSQIIQKPEIVLEDFFPLPPGLVGVTRKTSEAGLYNTEEIGTLADSTMARDVEVITGGSDTQLRAPGYVRVVGTPTVRYVAGKYFVDIEVEIEDVPGATNYELRVVKT